jgi:hypothetical protein
MRRALLVLLPLIVSSQDSPVVHGVLVRRDPGVRSGQLTLRTADDRVLRYRFDPQTYVERDSRTIEIAQLQAGEQLEVVSEAMPGTALRAARSIHVISAALPAHHLPTPPLRRVPVEIAKDTVTISGLVRSVTAARLLLHTREGEDREIVLRPDTRYVDNGEVVAGTSLKSNMRVSVRGAQNEANHIEAIEVIWGSMLAPK